MSTDRFITWKDTPEWGPPTPEKIAAVAIDFLGDRWTAEIEPFPQGDGAWINIGCEDRCTFHLASERPEVGDPYKLPGDEGWIERGFQVYFPNQQEKNRRTSVITRMCDSFTSALADKFTRIIAAWWHGEVEWPS